MRVIITLFLVAALATLAATAQESKIDSLFRLEQKANDNLSKIKLLHQIVNIYWDYDYEKAHSAAKKEYDLAKKEQHPESLTIALTDIGMYFYFTGNYDEAARYYQQAIEASGGKNFGEYPAYTLTRIGNLYKVQGIYDSAIVYYQRTEELLKGIPAGRALGSVYFHYGWMYQELSEFDKALGYLYKARDVRYTVGDSLLIADCWRLMAATHFGMGHADSAMYYINRTMEVARRYKDNELLIFSNINLGDIYSARNQSIEAIKAYELALNSLGKHDFKRQKALALFRVGRVFDSRGEYLKALEYYFNALKLDEELRSGHDIARVNAWIGWSYYNLKNYVPAEEYGRKSLLQMKQIKDKAGEAFAHNLLGNIKFDQKAYVHSLAHYDSSLVFRRALHLNTLVANTLFNIARVYRAQGRYEEALKYLREDLEFARSLNNTRIVAATSTFIGMVYSDKRDFVKAEKYLTEGLAILSKNGLPVDRRDNYLGFARMYRQAGKHSHASAYYERYITLNDSIVNRENSLAAIQRDALYQLDKKEREIESLHEQNKVKEAQIETQNARIRFQNILMGLILLALVLISLITYVLFRYYKSKIIANNELNKLNKEIREQKEEIQAQSEELIEASETIQEINKGLENSVEERTQQLKEAYQELDMFIYRSSHDFRRPLTTFMGLAEVAKISVKDSAALELFTKVNETAHNLDRMLGKLQSVSQISSTDLILREVLFDNELNFVLDLQRKAIIEKRIRVERRVEVAVAYNSYPLIVRIILENLIENAIHFSSPVNPFIQIEVRQVKEGVDGIRINVTDNGEGVAEEFRNRLFEMYFRANERSKGNGLGLYLVKKAVEKLQGKASFEGNPGQGSSFTVFLPYFEK